MREDILIGIELAVSRGQSLKQAMQSFYNAGYDKGEIEEAAREFLNRQNSSDIEKEQEMVRPIGKNKSKVEVKKKNVQKESKYIEEKPDKSNVSKYETPKKKGIKKITLIVLIVLAVLAITTGILIFVYWDALMGLF